MDHGGNLDRSIIYFKILYFYLIKAGVPEWTSNVFYAICTLKMQQSFCYIYHFIASQLSSFLMLIVEVNLLVDNSSFCTCRLHYLILGTDFLNARVSILQVNTKNHKKSSVFPEAISDSMQYLNPLTANGLFYPMIYMI